MHLKNTGQRYRSLGDKTSKLGLTEHECAFYTAVVEVKDKTLPDSYGRMLFKSTCDRVYNIIYERAYQGLAWAA